MQKSLISTVNSEALSKVVFRVGTPEGLINECLSAGVKVPFDGLITDFLHLVSAKIREDRNTKAYPDVVTLGFFMRKTSVLSLKERFCPDMEEKKNQIYLGRGVVFHIAPSNVAVNFAYSLVSGLVTGNVNIVRLPSKHFPQVDLICDAINKALNEMPEMKPFIYLVKYEKNREINDLFSAIADVRVIWGGDNTIAELRKSPLGPRATEVTFADRYSLAIINSDDYMAIENKKQFSKDFYNDTYLTDQNACTSPRMVVWTGGSRQEAKELFWNELHELVKSNYNFQQIMGVNKLTSAYILASKCIREKNDGNIPDGNDSGAYYKPFVIHGEDNLVYRICVTNPDAKLMNYKDNSGYFFEYDCEDIMELRDFCDDIHCQTIGYLGNKEDIIPLLLSGIKGVDRVVPIGKTMDFDFIWDGYNLFERLTRTIDLKI